MRQGLYRVWGAVVSLALVAPENAEAIPVNGSPEIGGEVAVALPDEPALALGGVALELDRLAREVSELAAIRTPSHWKSFPPCPVTTLQTVP
jgi:hypothetical protein